MSLVEKQMKQIVEINAEFIQSDDVNFPDFMEMVLRCPDKQENSTNETDKK